QARLADSGRPGDSDRVRIARLRVQVADEVVGQRIRALDERDRPGERPAIAGADAGGQRLPRPLAAPGHQRVAGSGNGAGARRSIAYAVTEATAMKQAAIAQTQRAPMASTSGPATAIPIPSTAKCKPMISVNARPRT